MNREEAIRYLSVHSSTNGSGLCTDEQHYEAKQMAIKALEQEPCGDAIDRKLVCAFIDGLISDDGERKKGLEYIRSMPPVETHDKRTETHACDYIRRQDVLNLAKKGVLISNGNYESVCKAINELPPVTSQLKTGHWIKENPPRVERYPFCSECGFVNPFENALNYCPNCGCRTVEPQESEE